MHVDSLVAGLLTTAYAVAARHGASPASLTVRLPIGVPHEEVRVRLEGRLTARFGFPVEVIVHIAEGSPEITSVELLAVGEDG